MRKTHLRGESMNRDKSTEEANGKIHPNQSFRPEFPFMLHEAYRVAQNTVMTLKFIFLME